MYEHLTLERSLLDIGETWASHLGWGSELDYGICKSWWNSQKLKKHQFLPSVVACSQSLGVTGLDWSVSWYAHDNHVDGLHIVGWPDQELMAVLLEVAESPGLREAYETKTAWLIKNPEYREKPPGPKSTKKANPKDYMITDAGT